MQQEYEFFFLNDEINKRKKKEEKEIRRYKLTDISIFC